MNYKVNDVVEFVLTWRNSDFEGVFKNILRFRGVEATMDTEEMDAFLEDGGQFQAHWTRIYECHLTTTYLDHVLVQNLTDLEQPTNEVLYGLGVDNHGSILPNDDDVPQASAAVTRKSFLRGRKSIGHYYHGPLSAHYTSEGILDPTGGLGGTDLTQVLDCLGDPLESGVTGWTARPIICNALGTGVVANNDVRVQTLARKTVYLKSRRPGIGE